MTCPNCGDDTLVVHTHEYWVTSRCRACGWVDTYLLGLMIPPGCHAGWHSGIRSGLAS